MTHPAASDRIRGNPRRRHLYPHRQGFAAGSDHRSIAHHHQTQDHLRNHRGGGRDRVGDHRVLPRRDGQCGVVRHRRDLHLRDRVPVLRAADRDEHRQARATTMPHPPRCSRTTPTTCRPTGGCCSAITSPRSRARVRWSARCLPCRWVICRAPSGSSSARYSPDVCRTTSCCGSPPDDGAARWVRWSATNSAPSAARPPSSGSSRS